MKVQLKPLEKSNREELAKLLNNKKIWDNLKDFIPHPYTLKDADFFIELTQKQSPQQTFAIVNEKNELLGIIGIVIQNDIHRMSAELGYWIGEPYWSKGIGTNAIKQITQYGFEELKLERIYAGVFAFNQASCKALEKNGYKLEGVFKNAIIKNDVVIDECRYAKLK